MQIINTRAAFHLFWDKCFTALNALYLSKARGPLDSALLFCGLRPRQLISEWIALQAVQFDFQQTVNLFH